MQEAQINPFRGHQTMDNMRQRYAADHPEPVSRFVVEKNVPMPDFFRRELPKNREAREFLSGMNIGDSVFVSNEADFKTLCYAISKLRRREAKGYAKRQFKGSEQTGWRVWRIS